LAVAVAVQELSPQLQMMVLLAVAVRAAALVVHGRLGEMGQEPQGKVTRVVMVLLTKVVAAAVALEPPGKTPPVEVHPKRELAEMV
jgi:hypothetical protein